LFRPNAQANLYANDTSFDPPEILDTSELRSALESALKELVLHQVTVQDHEPRQLVPVSVRKLQRVRIGQEMPDDDQ